MNRLKLPHIILYTLIILGLARGQAHALYEIGIGISGGITYDHTNLEGEIGRYNNAIEYYKASNAGTSVTQLNVPYEGVFGLNTRFRIDFFLIKIGCYYSQAFLYPTMGSIENSSGIFNTIRFNSWQVSLPLSVGFLLEASRRCWFSLGGGFNTFLVHIEIKQSNPDPAWGLPGDRRKDTFDTHLFGYHLFIGVELPLIIKRLSISAEWIYQRGISDPVKSSNSSEKRTIDVSGNYILLGINYYFTI